MTDRQKQSILRTIKSAGWKIIKEILEDEIYRLGDEKNLKVDGKSMEEVGFEFLSNRKARAVIERVIKQIENLEYQFNKETNKWV